MDIFPTIFEALDIPFDNFKHGTSLLKLINNEKIEENDIFLHTIPYEKESELDSIGLRTGKYKYFRNSRDSKKNVNLYNLKNDPYENYNIAENNPEIINEMENTIDNMKRDKIEVDETLTEEEEREISKELKELGYM